MKMKICTQCNFNVPPLAHVCGHCHAKFYKAKIETKKGFFSRLFNGIGTAIVWAVASFFIFALLGEFIPKLHDKVGPLLILFATSYGLINGFDDAYEYTIIDVSTLDEELLPDSGYMWYTDHSGAMHMIPEEAA